MNLKVVDEVNPQKAAFVAGKIGVPTEVLMGWLIDERIPRSYREANKEKIADYQAAYYEANKQKLLDYQRRYRQKKREAKKNAASRCARPESGNGKESTTILTL